VLIVVKDLFFVARIRETARLVGVPAVFARTPDEVERAAARSPAFALLDLTSDLDYEAIFSCLERARVAIVGFTTHARARQTQPWHARCRRVITKETLTQQLGTLLQERSA
jgi:hypothetical protein